MDKLLTLVFCIFALGRAEKYIYKIKELTSTNDLITIEQSDRTKIDGFETKGYNYTITINNDISDANDISFKYFLSKTETKGSSSLCNVNGEGFDGATAKIALQILGLSDEQLSCPISPSTNNLQSIFRATVDIDDFIFEDGVSADVKMVADDLTIEVTIATPENP